MAAEKERERMIEAMTKKDLPSHEALREIEHRIREAFEARKREIRADIACLPMRGYFLEYVARGREFENSRMLSEIRDIIGQIECDIENAKQFKVTP